MKINKGMGFSPHPFNLKTKKYLTNEIMRKRLTIDQIVSIRRDEVKFKVNGDNSLYLLSLAEIEDCKWDEKVLDLTFNYELKQGTNIVGEVHKIKDADYDYYVGDIDFPWEVN